MFFFFLTGSRINYISTHFLFLSHFHTQPLSAKLPYFTTPQLAIVYKTIKKRSLDSLLRKQSKTFKMHCVHMFQNKGKM